MSAAGYAEAIAAAKAGDIDALNAIEVKSLRTFGVRPHDDEGGGGFHGEGGTFLYQYCEPVRILRHYSPLVVEWQDPMESCIGCCTDIDGRILKEWI